MMEKYNQLLEEISKYFNRPNPTPFMLFNDCGKPFTVLGENKEGCYFISPYFTLKNILMDGSCIELMVLEPVETDGCPVEYPDCFYSLRTTGSCIIVSYDCFCGSQTYPCEYVDREIIESCPKDC